MKYYVVFEVMAKHLKMKLPRLPRIEAILGVTKPIQDALAHFNSEKSNNELGTVIVVFQHVINLLKDQNRTTRDGFNLFRNAACAKFQKYVDKFTKNDLVCRSMLLDGRMSMAPFSPEQVDRAKKYSAFENCRSGNFKNFTFLVQNWSEK